MAERVTKKGLIARLKEAARRRSFFGKIEEIADRRRHAFNRRVQQAKLNVEHLHESIKDIERSIRTPEERHEARREIANLNEMLALAENRLRRMRRKREFWRSRYVWAHARHMHWGSVWRSRRDRLRRWIRQHQGFQPYMANGNPHKHMTAEAKHGMYLDFRDGNFITSTYEGFPGDGVHSTSSGHYLQNQPDGRGRCWDSGAGTRGPMVKAQRREARRAGSFLVELFGPDNDTAYKNGIRFTMGEGEVLEDMHDNHKHTWLRDGAPSP